MNAVTVRYLALSLLRASFLAGGASAPGASGARLLLAAASGRCGDRHCLALTGQDSSAGAACAHARQWRVDTPSLSVCVPLRGGRRRLWRERSAGASMAAGARHRALCCRLLPGKHLCHLCLRRRGVGVRSVYRCRLSSAAVALCLCVFWACHPLPHRLLCMRRCHPAGIYTPALQAAALDGVPAHAVPPASGVTAALNVKHGRRQRAVAWPGLLLIS